MKSTYYPVLTPCILYNHGAKFQRRIAIALADGTDHQEAPAGPFFLNEFSGSSILLDNPRGWLGKMAISMYQCLTVQKYISARPDSNQWPFELQSNALPLSYSRFYDHLHKFYKPIYITRLLNNVGDFSELLALSHLLTFVAYQLYTIQSIARWIGVLLHYCTTKMIPSLWRKYILFASQV